MSLRDKFIAAFGEADCLAIEAAAEEHENGLHPNRGTDPFQWTLMLAISYQCMEIDHYREYHGVTTPWPELKAWIIREARMGEYDGDVDALAMFTGSYDEYVKGPV